MCENAYPPDLLVTSGTLEQFKSELSALYAYGEAFKNRRIGAKDDLSMFPIWYLFDLIEMKNSSFLKENRTLDVGSKWWVLEEQQNKWTPFWHIDMIIKVFNVQPERVLERLKLKPCQDPEDYLSMAYVA